MRRLVKRLVQEVVGATSVEYAILGSCIALVIVTAVSTVGTALNSSYTNIAAAFK